MAVAEDLAPESQLALAWPPVSPELGSAFSCPCSSCHLTLGHTGRVLSECSCHQ